MEGTLLSVTAQVTEDEALPPLSWYSVIMHKSE
jgi:hypothetical protein